MEGFPDGLQVNLDWRSYIFTSPSPRALVGSVKTRLGVDFKEAEKEVRPVPVRIGQGNSIVLSVNQQLGNDYNVKGDELGVGAVVWDAAIVLGWFLEAFPEIVKGGKTVIDLGSGTGICGILAAIFMGIGEEGSKGSLGKVVCTDHGRLEALCRGNVSTAQETFSGLGGGWEGVVRCLGEVEFCHFWWGGGLPDRVRELGERGGGRESSSTLLSRATTFTTMTPSLLSWNHSRLLLDRGPL